MAANMDETSGKGNISKRAVMKLNAKSDKDSLETLIYRTCAVCWIIAVVIGSIDAIRVYEGTNIPAPTSKINKNSGLSKKATYISKRSWNVGEENLKSLKADRKSEGKRKEASKRSSDDGNPPLYKIRFGDKKLMQYLKYIKEIPRLEEYTLCMWFMPTNLTHDQTLFSYSLNKNERLLRFWVNAYDSSLRMAIRDFVVYKVPTNIREYRWHHICQSWNGVSGEWKVFLDGRRIGGGVLSHYQGTYIPEGGELTLGQELIGLQKGSDEGLVGEVFGFNLVDESVPHDQANFINSQYKPHVQSVPPFKKLPPIKKTYQEIKAYISTLPRDPSETRKGNEAIPLLHDETNSIKKAKETYSVPPKRNRGNHRIRYPPLRKVVVYNRDDRQLALNEANIEINKTKPATTTERTKIESVESHQKNQTSTQTPEIVTVNQLYDENYSIHSYRHGKDDKKSSNYEIYEVVEDDVVKSPEEDKLISGDVAQKESRQIFNLFTARAANKVYTLANSVKDPRKPKFHFETRLEENAGPDTSNRRSFDAEEVNVTPIQVTKIGAERKVSDSIPVYETEVLGSRRKRSAKEERDSRQFIPVPHDPLIDENGFRRLPKIPDSFINIFSQNASRQEIQEKLKEFFPNDTTTEVLSLITEATEPSDIFSVILDEDASASSIQSRNVQTSTETIPTAATEQSPQRNTLAPIYQIPATSQESQQQQPFALTMLTETRPINFPMIPEDMEEFHPGRPTADSNPINRYGLPTRGVEPTSDRRKFDISSGTDLIMRSYGLCTADRGSPIEDKRHLVISWADTPVRIFGGAEIQSAKNECGNF